MPTNFNLAEVLYTLQLHRKKMIGVVIIALIIAAITLFFVPRYFRSTAYVLPSNPELADKERAAYNNLQRLYSYFGNGDDLDLLYGMTRLDTLYYQLTDSFHLVNTYGIKASTEALRRFEAMKLLKENLQFKKTENNQLAIRVWDKNPLLAANIANAAVALLKQSEENLWLLNYQNTMHSLQNQIQALQQKIIETEQQLAVPGTANATILETNKTQYLQQLAQYQKNLTDLQLAIQNVAPGLYVVEKATPAVKPDRPKPILVLITVTIISFVFAATAVLIYFRNRIE
ncbi:Wzz/FepE/Etk N-terminal domain-containing protein [Hydrotalea sp.]|uniref:Wzz/FepE/Etk N-terminal domain-containing protein n=1 Tax=Hydrotalea sp. TaxID=2881279 RepID=UPI00261CFCF0|nr:Wzz/FepE/Etk N-terminal domain-containing protein [Hydrotalea sp.]